MTVYRTMFFALAACMAAVFLPAVAMARSPSPAVRVAEGNRAYEEGRFDDALAAYEQASETLSDNAVVKFNKGAALYRKGDYNAAEAAFRNAADLSDDLKVKSRALYNSGNSAFKQGKLKLADDDLEAALKLCERSATAFRKAGELDPDFHPAVENLEIARLTMRAILDEIQAREEERQRMEQLQQELMEQLQEIMEQQQELRDQTEQSEEKQEPDDSNTGESMAERQASLKQDTEQAADAAGQAGAPEEFLERLDSAAKHQAQAEEKLKQQEFGEALSEQEKALEELKQALESAMSDDDKAERPEKPGDPHEGEAQAEQADAAPVDTPEDKTDMEDMPDDGETEEPGEPVNRDAHEIIEREKQNRARRMRDERIRFEPVERDW